MKAWIGVAVTSLALGGSAHAAVVDQWDTGFTTKTVVEAGVRADRAYQGLGEIGRWWSNDHTYSGKASNITLELKPGACMCEALPGGGVAHGIVVLAWPAQGTLRLDGAFGPLQEMGVSGAMTFVVKPKGAGRAEITQTYTVGGGKPGTAKQLAAIVGQVVGEQLRRYGRYLETGKPD